MALGAAAAASYGGGGACTAMEKALPQRESGTDPCGPLGPAAGGL